MQKSSVNKVIIVGYLGHNPEARFTPQGTAVTNISVATKESWKNQSGELQERTEWHRVSLFGKVAEIAGQYLDKGSKVYVEGKLQTRKWQDQSGQDRYTTEVVISGYSGTLQMLDRRDDMNSSAPMQQSQAQAQQGSKPAPAITPVATDEFEDDIPF